MSTASFEHTAETAFAGEVNKLVDSLISQHRITDFSDAAVTAMLGAIECSIIEQQKLNQRLGSFYTAESAQRTGRHQQAGLV